jgi:hypothetical protein
MDRKLEEPVVYYTVNAYGELRKHTMIQLELPFGPSNPGRVVKIRPYDEDCIAEDLDDMDSETEAVVRE